MSGQAEQELVKAVDGRKFGKKVGWQVTGTIGRWEAGCTQDVGRYVDPVREERKENDVVGKNVDTCTQIVEAFGHEIDGEVLP